MILRKRDRGGGGVNRNKGDRRGRGIIGRRGMVRVGNCKWFLYETISSSIYY